MPTVINGLPAHVLLIHVIVVLTPIAALFTVLMAAWPAAYRRIGVFGPITALIVLIFVPITTNAGEWYQNKIDPQHKNPLIEHHQELGDTFLLFAIGLFIVSAAVWYVGRRLEFGLIGLQRSTTETPSKDTSGGGTATLVRAETSTAKQVAPLWLSIVIVVVSVAMAAAALYQLVRIGDSGAKAVFGGNL